MGIVKWFYNKYKNRDVSDRPSICVATFNGERVIDGNKYSFSSSYMNNNVHVNVEECISIGSNDHFKSSYCTCIIEGYEYITTEKCDIRNIYNSSDFEIIHNNVWERTTSCGCASLADVNIMEGDRLNMHDIAILMYEYIDANNTVKGHDINFNLGNHIIYSKDMGVQCAVINNIDITKSACIGCHTCLGWEYNFKFVNVTTEHTYICKGNASTAKDMAEACVNYMVNQWIADYEEVELAKLICKE